MARSKAAQEAIEDAMSITYSEGEVGLGVDIIEVERMERVLERTPSFIEKIFSPEEIEYCESTAYPAIHYAARFAAKEAVVKALGVGFTCGIGYQDIEVVKDKVEKPQVKLYRKAKEVAESSEIEEIALSISHTRKDAIACAIAINEHSRVKIEQRYDPIEDISRQFKEAKSILDEL